MVEDLKWFRVKKGGEKNLCNFFTLGRLKNKNAALDRLNITFAKRTFSIPCYTGKEQLFLTEGDLNNHKEYPLIISGEGCDRIATIGF